MRGKRFLLLTLSLVLLSVTTTVEAQTSDDVIRINNSQPIINQDMFLAVGAEDEGENINGPSLIRIPDWIEPADRADPSAVYYLYFGHHSGDYIRMAWAADITGPWTLYKSGSDFDVGNRGVLDNNEADIDLGMGVVIGENHLASPDVHVDDANQQIIMYFHSGASSFFNDTEMDGQFSWVTTSPFGLDFNDNIRPVRLATSYQRVFEHGGEVYSFDNSQYPRRALDPNNPWEPTANYYSGSTIPSLWERYPEEFTQDPITQFFGVPRSQLRVRHTGVHVEGDNLRVFYSQRGDNPERIMMSPVDLSVGDWENWVFTYPPVELLQAVSGWEGGQFEPENSVLGAAPENVNQLRDPYLFEDSDGSQYLLYTGCGEDAIGIAALATSQQIIEVFTPTDDTYVRDGSSQNDNFGNEDDLEVRYSNNDDLARRALVKFDLTNVSNVEAAVFRLYADQTRSLSITVFETNSSWSEGTVTWNSAPPEGDPIATIEIGPDDQWYEWDATAFAQASEGQEMSLIFFDTTQGDQLIEFNSKEGNNSPELKVLTSPVTLLLVDVNRNGVVNFLDVSPFITLLTRNNYLLEGDMNQDGVVNFLDISTFISVLN